VEVEIIYLNS